MNAASAKVLAAVMPDDPTFRVALTVEGMRQLVDRIRVMNGPGPAMARVTHHAVPGADASVGVRLLEPIPEPLGVILGMGCGGWVAGTADAWDTIGRKLAERTSCAVALVDFRRAPEHRYPAAIDDVFAASQWLWRTRQALGYDGLPYMILGEGMGAALAATTVARAARDPSGPSFALQLLICPMTDATTGPDTSVRDALVLSGKALAEFWDWYVPDAAQRADPDVSPLRIPDLAGSPPTVVVTAELDPAVAEGVAFVGRLREAGVAVAHRHYDGQGYGFFSMLAIPAGERVFQHVVRAVRGYIGRFCLSDTPPPLEMDAWLNRTIR